MSPLKCLACELCDKTFSKRYNLNRHYKNIHSVSVVDKSKRLTDWKCAVCAIVSNNFREFKDHLWKVHNIELKIQHLEFQTDQDFKEWKKSIEEQDSASYVKHTSDKYHPGWRLGYYQCHRSGYFREKLKSCKRQREIKIQGTTKINASCPARITARTYNDGSVKVEYCSTHVGHHMELAHLPIPIDDRKKLATKIADKIPFETILDEVQTSVNDRLHRTHLITKQDLRNIVREFALDRPRSRDCVHHFDDSFSIDEWVKKECSGEKSCVILYKPKGVNMPQYPHFKNEDFMLGIMNEAQAEILKKYGSDCICLDSTFKTNVNTYEMTTLLVLDDLRQGFPCAFFFSNNRHHQIGIENFLIAIRDRVGFINCSVLMTDMAETFYKSWQNIMGDSEKLLSCKWYAKRAWKKRIGFCKNQEESKLKETKKIYAVHGTNKKICLDGFYSVIKHLYHKWEMEKRLDKSVHLIMRFINRKLFDRLLVLEKGKITKTLRNLRQRHKTSLTNIFDKVVQSSNDSWSVVSSSSTDMYNVERAETNCSCSLICEHCKVCIHMFNCTCIDSSIKWNMCKHIHLVCHMLEAKGSIQSNIENPVKIVEDHSYHRTTKKSLLYVKECANEKEKVAILKTVGKVEDLHTNLNLDLLKKKVSDEFNLIISKVKCIEQVDLVDITLKNLKPLLVSVEEDSHIQGFSEADTR